MISSVPIVREKYPHWASLVAARKFAQAVNRVKLDANLNHAAYRIRWSGQGLGYVVERGHDCATQVWEPFSAGDLGNGKFGVDLGVVEPERGKQLGVPGLSPTFCYDYLLGSASALHDAGFGFAPTADIEQGRADRIAILLLSGPSAELAFE